MQNAEIKKQFVNLIAKQAEILTAVVNPFYLGRLSILTPNVLVSLPTTALGVKQNLLFTNGLVCTFGGRLSSFINVLVRMASSSY